MVAAIGLAVVGFVAWWDDSSTEEDPAAAGPPAVKHSEFGPGQRMTAFGAWAAGLPVGELPTKPYLQGSVVHNGEVEWSTRGESYWRVLDKVPGGYLVQGGVGPHYEWRFGVRGTNGDVSWLSSREFDNALAVLSTDHTRLAVLADSDIHLYDLKQRTEVASLRESGFVEPIQLVDAGLIYTLYAGGPGQVRLWNPGDDPQVLHYQPAVVSDDMTRALVYRSRNPCWRAADIAGEEVVRYLFESCRLQRTYTVSPDGAHAFTVDRNVVDLDTGQVSAFKGAPSHGALMPYAVWEDNERILLRIPLNKTGSRLYGKAVTIRCSVLILTCERVPEGDGPSIQVLDATRTPP